MPRPALYDLGIYPTLTLTSEQAHALTTADVGDLRALDATEAMLDQLRALARVPDRELLLDFARQTVTIIT